jgi:hypothetical protein
MWEELQNAWGYVSGAVSSAYSGSFLESLYESAEGAYESAQAFGKRNPLLTEFAGAAAKSLTGKDSRAALPSGKRTSIRSGVQAGSYKASPADLGFTPRVLDKIRAAQNSQVGGSIQGTLSRLQGRPSKGPTIGLQATPIAVQPRSR